MDGARAAMTIAQVPVSGEAHRQMVALRDRLLRRPLNLAYTAEQLAAETTQLHFAALHNEMVIGTLLAVPPDKHGTAKLRQMAIEPGFERQGVGSALVRDAERVLSALGAVNLTLSARATAVGFYEKLGYVAEGAAFIEVTLPHLRMGKRLQGQGSPSGAFPHGRSGPCGTFGSSALHPLKAPP